MTPRLVDSGNGCATRESLAAVIDWLGSIRSPDAAHWAGLIQAGIDGIGNDLPGAMSWAGATHWARMAIEKFGGAS